ncbi:MAG: hypothetical protein R3C04_00450 [Hyphomonas sp.]
MVFGGVTIVESAVEPAPVSPFDWRATRTPDGDWVLAGYAPTRRIREQIAGDADRWAEGRAVANQMKLAASLGGNHRASARLGLEILSDTDSGEARLIDRTLRVSAVVMDSAERARLSAMVANIAPPYRGQPLIKGPSLWTATHEADGLVLSGKVRTEAERGGDRLHRKGQLCRCGDRPAETGRATRLMTGWTACVWDCRILRASPPARWDCIPSPAMSALPSKARRADRPCNTFARTWRNWAASIPSTS